MTEPTTTETPVSATQLAAAHEDFTKAETWLREAPEWHHERRVWTERKIAADSIIRRAAQARPPAAPTMTAEQRAAAITARRQTHAAMLDETEGSEMSRALLDVAVEQSTALHAGDAVPGAFGEQDVDRAAREGAAAVGRGPHPSLVGVVAERRGIRSPRRCVCRGVEQAPGAGAALPHGVPRGPRRRRADRAIRAARPAMTTEAPVTLTLEQRVEMLEEVLGDLGSFAFVSIAGRHLRLTSAAADALSKLGEAEAQRVRSRLAESPRPWLSSADVERARASRQTDIEGGKA